MDFRDPWVRVLVPGDEGPARGAFITRSVQSLPVPSMCVMHGQLPFERVRCIFNSCRSGAPLKVVSFGPRAAVTTTLI
jgi:hypothetical protein